MSEEQIKPNPMAASTQDGQLAAENMATGKEKLPTIDVDADYQAAQQFNVSDVDRTGTGADAAATATAHKFEMHEPETTKMVAESTSDPHDYMQMAHDITGSKSAAGNVSDDLVHRALEMGEPGK